MKRIICVALLLTSLFGLKVQVQAQSLSDYRWLPIEAKGDVVGRHENGFVAFKDKFYLIGGRGVNPVNVFDPKNNTWETKSKSPMEIHHFQAVVYGDAIYLVGAMTGGYPKELPLDCIWKYYPETDKWEKGDEIPVARRRGGSGAVVYNDKIYIACGIKFGHTSGTTNMFDSYDLKTGKWEMLTDAPHIRDHFPAIVANDKMYCIGGRNTSVHHHGNFAAFFNETSPKVDYYDFKEGKWYTLKEPLPVPTAGGGLVKIDDRLLYIGGEGSQPQAYSNTQCLDLNTAKWTQLAQMHTARHGSGAVLYNNEIFLAAGSPNRGGGNLSTIDKFTQAHNYKSLFNGKNLDGWQVKAVKSDFKKIFWTVENGAILCNSVGEKDHDYVWLQSDKEYEDFEIILKFKASNDNKGNSGLQVRSRYDDKSVVNKDVKGWLDGPQIDIAPANPWRTGAIYDETRTEKRWLCPSLPDYKISKENTTHKNVVFYSENEYSGWNTLRVVCIGTTIRTYVNNFLVSDYDGAGVLDNDDHKKYNVGLKGHFALQLHQKDENKIWFKDIEVREFK
jgi:N-acetylneuraminic acid mutarotase